VTRAVQIANLSKMSSRATRGDMEHYSAGQVDHAWTESFPSSINFVDPLAD
jgi:hypothetical protein